MSDIDAGRALAREIGLLLEPVGAAAADPFLLARLLDELGWDLDSLTSFPVDRFRQLLARSARTSVKSPPRPRRWSISGPAVQSTRAATQPDLAPVGPLGGTRPVVVSESPDTTTDRREPRIRSVRVRLSARTTSGVLPARGPDAVSRRRPQLGHAVSRPDAADGRTGKSSHGISCATTRLPGCRRGRA
jgi:hypothetical protein